MSYTHITSIWSEEDLFYWVRDDGYLDFLKKISPAAGTLIGNLLKRRAGLRRPTASGLDCGRRAPPWHTLYSHHVYLIWSGLSFKLEIMKNSVFWNLLPGYPQKTGSLYPITSFGDEPNRSRHFWTPLLILLSTPWHTLYSHHVYLIWSGLSFGSKMKKK